MNKIFDQLLLEKAEVFKENFLNVSRGLYCINEEDNLSYHNAEFGRYREQISKDFIKFFIPNAL